jgi:hypothetical protein
MQAVERTDARFAPRKNYGRLPAATAAPAAATSTTAAASTATITSATASATTAARTAAALTRTGFVDADIAPFEFGVIKFFDRPSGVVRVCHFDESEAARLSRELVDHNDGAVDFAGLREQPFKIFVGHRVGQIAYVQFCGHSVPLLDQCRRARDSKNPEVGLMKSASGSVSISI